MAVKRSDSSRHECASRRAESHQKDIVAFVAALWETASVIRSFSVATEQYANDYTQTKQYVDNHTASMAVNMSVTSYKSMSAMIMQLVHAMLQDLSSDRVSSCTLSSCLA